MFLGRQPYVFVSVGFVSESSGWRSVGDDAFLGRTQTVDGRVLKSIDAGQTWLGSDFRSSAHRIISIAVHPQHPNTIYAVTANCGYDEANSALWKSTDDDLESQKLDRGFVRKGQN